MRRRLRSGLLRLPGSLGYRMARVLGIRASGAVPRIDDLQVASMSANGGGPADAPPTPTSGAPLTVELEEVGRRKRLRVRAAGDIWSEEFRVELASDRRFEASLVWREFVILLFIGAVLAARTLLS